MNITNEQIIAKIDRLVKQGHRVSLEVKNPFLNPLWQTRDSIIFSIGQIEVEKRTILVSCSYCLSINMSYIRLKGDKVFNHIKRIYHRQQQEEREKQKQHILNYFNS